MDKYNVAIVGCGSIGALKDDRFDSPTTRNILTHAHAANVHPNARLVGFVDVDIEKAVQAAGKWGGTFHNNVEGLFCGTKLGTDIDIVIIATPTETHVEIINQVLNYEPSLIIGEKPLGTSAAECQSIVDACKEARIPLLVNYTRRFDTTTRTIKRLFTQGYYGKAQACTIIYNRGLKRDGCHALDFLLWFFGNALGGSPLLGGGEIHDFSTEDPTRAYYMVFKKCPHIFMIPADGRIFSIFEIEIIFERAIIKWQNSGLEVIKRDLIDSPYGPYKTVSTAQKESLTQLSEALLRLLGNAIDHLKYDDVLLGCTGEDALAVHKMIENLRS